MPDDLGKRLIKFMKGGNKYEAFVKSANSQNVTIFIHELKRSSKFKDQPSFVYSTEKKLRLKNEGAKNYRESSESGALDE